MIPEFAIRAWREYAPWIRDEQVEQDLLICRAIIAIFSDEYLRQHLAFRGGTAIHKLFLHPQSRYSEDIDLVQISSEPIKATYDRLWKVLDFLGKPSIKQKKYNNTLIYHLDSESIPSVPINLKVEINCKEHFSVYPMIKMPFSIDNMWFRGGCEITTYQIDELIGTKVRALYQRCKGRDLFDLNKALILCNLDIDRVLESYHKYMNFVVSHIPTRKEYLINMENKMQDPEFLDDIKEFIPAYEIYDPYEAFENVKEKILDRLK
ncbi:MAG: nucleotidyl transferase AbiEii/AbiGii toxin family protein [Bacteroidales bacterium]|jgi:predicted nucleotidyltransferase component of viral defense system|nr:nucleotidyl transferase AbiEii/AbiGii toxin family protein [Bacteroidales bacterium]